MGTNYYLRPDPCECCGRGLEPLHIGKSCMGWCFRLHVYPPGLYCPDWLEGLLPEKRPQDWDTMKGFLLAAQVVPARRSSELSERLPQALAATRCTIQDGCGQVVNWFKFLETVYNRRALTADPDWLLMNGAIEGPNHMARVPIDQHVIGHHDTLPIDYSADEFS